MLLGGRDNLCAFYRLALIQAQQRRIGLPDRAHVELVEWIVDRVQQVKRGLARLRNFHGELQPIEGKSREIDGAKNSLEVQGHRDPPTSIKSALMYISNATLQHSRRLRVTCLGVFSDLTAGSAFAIMIAGAAMKPTVGIFIHRNDAETAVKALRTQGIAERDINQLFPGAPEDALRGLPTDEGEQPGMGEAVGAVVGTGLGASSGAYLGAVASALIPGIGPVVAIGVGAAALLGIAGAVGGAAPGGAPRAAPRSKTRTRKPSRRTNGWSTKTRYAKGTRLSSSVQPAMPKPRPCAGRSSATAPRASMPRASAGGSDFGAPKRSTIIMAISKPSSRAFAAASKRRSIPIPAGILTQRSRRSCASAAPMNIRIPPFATAIAAVKNTVSRAKLLNHRGTSGLTTRMAGVG